MTRDISPDAQDFATEAEYDAALASWTRRERFNAVLDALGDLCTLAFLFVIAGLCAAFLVAP